MSDADTAATIALNVIAPTRLARAVLPGFLKRDTGAIINIASIMAFHALPITTLYSATKSYVLTFSRGLQGELAATGVRVQAVLPAGTATEFYDHSGVPLSAFDPAAVMTTENLVDARLLALTGMRKLGFLRFTTTNYGRLMSKRGARCSGRPRLAYQHRATTKANGCLPATRQRVPDICDLIRRRYALGHCPSRLMPGSWRDSQSEKHEDCLVEPQDIFVVQPPTRAPTFVLGAVVILSTIKRHAARNPLRSFGSTGRRNNGASVSSVVKAQMMIESVASKLSS
ncbi:hypothetical protein J3R73_005382 [Labrys monachus]|uniref:Uncharacterized protein n=1 Tax=Labrys monachus TaxID=217067 RepID=A0ABU0FLV9_9HYPH|nr:hypothetical protein [Labrys monachus]